MVQLMKNNNNNNGSSRTDIMAAAVVKSEIQEEDPLEDEHAPFHKRPKQNQSFDVGVSQQYNPLNEPSPLGLRLRKSPSLLELIQMRLSESSSSRSGGHAHGKKEAKGSGGGGDKLKASNFPASVLRIGTWEYKSRHEGDLVAKCYFAKHKLVWEVLDGGLKNKIEIQWSDIMALKANCPEDAPSTLDVVLARQPLFFRETNPQPRKHTLWQATSDFTGGEASINRRHYLEAPQGLLGKHFEKLTQCDPRLHFLSQQGEITLDSPYFEPRASVFEDQSEDNNDFDLNAEGSSSFLSLQDTISQSGIQSSSSRNDHDARGKQSEFYHRETPSPSSAREIFTIEDIKAGGIEQLKALGGNLDQVRVQGLHSSMSMSDLVSHLEQRVSEQGNSALSNEDWESLEILDDINRCLFTDVQEMPDSDEKSLMSRVNSLCCLLQKEPTVQPKVEKYADTEKKVHEYKNTGASTSGYMFEDDRSDEDAEMGMSRKDSVGELLLNLPRIASMPQFLFNISEDHENKAR